MSNAIQFLESMGSNAAFGRLSAADYAAAIAQLDADAAQQRALLERDHCALSNLLGGREKVMCMVWPAECDDTGHAEQSESVKRGEIRHAS